MALQSAWNARIAGLRRIGGQPIQPHAEKYLKDFKFTDWYAVRQAVPAGADEGKIAVPGVAAGEFAMTPWPVIGSVEEDLGFASVTLHKQFFAPYWEDIVLGRAGLMEHLTTALLEIAPQVSPDQFVSYWFKKDSRLAAPLLQELSVLRSSGIRVHLATNQEHLRAAWLMEIAGRPRNGPEPRADARVAFLFLPDLFHPLLAFF